MLEARSLHRSVKQKGLTQPIVITMQWILYNEGKRYPVVSDGNAYRAMIEREGGPEALKQWKSLEKAIKPLQEGAASFPAAAIRNDIGKLCRILI